MSDDTLFSAVLIGGDTRLRIAHSPTDDPTHQHVRVDHPTWRRGVFVGTRAPLCPATLRRRTYNEPGYLVVLHPDKKVQLAAADLDRARHITAAFGLGTARRYVSALVGDQVTLAVVPPDRIGPPWHRHVATMALMTRDTY